MTAFIYFVMSPGGMATMFALAVLAIVARPQSRAIRRTALIVALAYVVASIYAVPATAARLLESGFRKFEPGDVPGGRTAIVLLGAGDETVFGWEDSDRLYLPYASAAARVLEARRVFRLIDAAWIISSGGKPSPDHPSEPASINMRNLLVSIGVPADRIVLESGSVNTHDEAVAVAAMLPSLHVDHIVVVTSAVHMRRSLGTFRNSGMHAIPAIVPHQSHGMNRWRHLLIPSYSGLSFTSDVVHELCGIPYYWLRGWL